MNSVKSSLWLSTLSFWGGDNAYRAVTGFVRQLSDISVSWHGCEAPGLVQIAIKLARLGRLRYVIALEASSREQFWLTVVTREDEAGYFE